MWSEDKYGDWLCPVCPRDGEGQRETDACLQKNWNSEVLPEFYSCSFTTNQPKFDLKVKKKKKKKLSSVYLSIYCLEREDMSAILSLYPLLYSGDNFLFAQYLFDN